MIKLYKKLINKFYKLLNGKIEIIGVGGVDSGESAHKKFLAGASYIQLYTGMVFQGPSIVIKIKKEKSKKNEVLNRKAKLAFKNFIFDFKNKNNQKFLKIIFNLIN